METDHEILPDKQQAEWQEWRDRMFPEPFTGDAMCDFCNKFRAKHLFDIEREGKKALCGRCSHWDIRRKEKVARCRRLGIPEIRKTIPRQDLPTDRVYFIQEGEAGHIKIGWASCVAIRLLELQTGNPRVLRVVGLLVGSRTRELEMHRKFKHLRIRGEWFQAGEDLVKFINTHDVRRKNDRR